MIKCKKNLHTLDEPKNNTRLQISTIIGENPQTVNNKMFCRYIDCIPPGGQNRSICCSTGEFLLDILKLIVTAVVCVATFTYY
jgi:hypothetical protein